MNGALAVEEHFNKETFENLIMDSTCRDGAIIWKWSWFEKLGYIGFVDDQIFCENQNIIVLSRERMARPRSKHIDVKYISFYQRNI